MTRPIAPPPAPQKQPPVLPRRLRQHDVNKPSAEGVREMRANLPGFFAVLREWAATEKARPPPLHPRRPV